MKKLLSLVLTLAMLCTMCVAFGITASAADSTLDTDVNLYSAFPSGSTITLAKDIESTDVALVIEGKTLIFDLNGKTLTMNSCIMVSSASEITFKNGTICTPSPRTVAANVISVFGNSKLNLENVKVLAGDSAAGNSGDDAINIGDTSTATIKDSYIKGGDVGAPSNYLTAGAAICLSDTESSATVTNSTLALGDGSHYYMAQSAISVYGNGTVYDGATNQKIVAPKFTSDADKTMLKVGTGSSLAPSDANDNNITTVGGTKSADVTATYVAGSASTTIYSVDVAWGSMEFTYTSASEGTWNPSTHTNDGATAASWSCDTDANKITVTNHSNAAVDAALSYTAETAYSAIRGTFTEASGTANDNKLELATAKDTTVANAPTASAALTLSGTLASDLTNTKIGSVTVTITEQIGLDVGGDEF